MSRVAHMRITKMIVSKFRVASFLVLALGLAACTDGTGTKQQVGTVIGAIGGAVAGSQFGSGRGRLATTAIGTLLGALAGSEVGKSLDKADKAHMHNAIETAQSAPVGQTIAWNNPNSGNSGTVKTVRDGTATDTGAYCREYQQTVTVGGRTEEAYGRACRQPDGSWKIVK